MQTKTHIIVQRFLVTIDLPRQAVRYVSDDGSTCTRYKVVPPKQIEVQVGINLEAVAKLLARKAYLNVSKVSKECGGHVSVKVMEGV